MDEGGIQTGAGSLGRLAELLRQHNAISDDVARLIGRPAEMGHVGEYIAAAVFGITLQASASQKGIDGHFVEGPLIGMSVNVKWYRKWEGVLDVTPQTLPDYYLVMTGPKSPAISSRGRTRPAVIDRVYVFDARTLYDQLLQRRVKIGIATSLAQQLWTQAEVYPQQRSSLLLLTDGQVRLLELFRSSWDESGAPAHEDRQTQ